MIRSVAPSRLSWRSLLPLRAWRAVYLSWLLLGVALVGCASRNEPFEPAPMQGGAAAAPPRVMPQNNAHSVLGRPIEMYSFGSVEGGRPVLVMGAIHGNEPTSADVSRGLLEELLADPRAATDGVGGVPVAIIPVANPDALAAGTRYNANKIDVNRNFPSRNFN